MKNFQRTLFPKGYAKYTFMIHLVLCFILHDVHSKIVSKEDYQSPMPDEDKFLLPATLDLWLTGVQNSLSDQYNKIPTLFITEEMARCYNDTMESMEAFKKGEMWALKMFDASSKVQSGFLEGNIANLGQYDECLKVETSSYKGQHCLVDITVNLSDSVYKELNIPKSALDGAIVMTTAVCLPSTCSYDLVDLLVNAQLRRINKYPFLVKHNIRLTADVSPTDCHVDITVPLTLSEYIVIGVCVMLLALVIVSTAFDILMKRRDANRITSKSQTLLCAFSATRNLRRLFYTNNNAEVLSGISGLKSISIAWVALGHRYKFTCQQPLTNLLFIGDLVGRYQTMLLLNAILSVDVFFLLSGLLNTYIYMKLPSRAHNVKMTVMNYVHRYLRLTPTYGLMIAITATLLYRMGDGPLWDRLVGSAVDDCKNNWLPGILYINNYYKAENYCMMQSWYLAADMQMFWFSPLLLYPLWKWPKFGIGLSLILVIASIFIPFYVAWTEEIMSPLPLSRNMTRVQNELLTLYLPTHTKTVSYILGILLGYLVFQIKTNKIKWSLSISQRIIGWVAAIVFMAGSLFGVFPLYQIDYEYNRWESSLYIAFYRFFWSLGVGWLILSCITGQAGYVGRLLDSKPFVILGRLTYSIYLTHVAVIIFKIGSARQPTFLTNYDQITQSFGEFVVTVFYATLLTLALESPFLVMEKLIIRGKGAVAPENNSNTTERSPNDADVVDLGSSDPVLQKSV